ncbi:MAG TPA: universal stress protein [Solirubrobacteraceae bacterium]|nr:universal stress protein [Solirubrobacteraceae bacterium]
MTNVIAAVGADTCAAPVLATANALADMLDATVMALHVEERNVPSLEALAKASRAEYRRVRGAPLERIVSAATEPDVAALVLGSRGASAGPRPAGATALEVITRTTQPVVLVEPEARPPERFSGLLVPIEGTGGPTCARRHHRRRRPPAAGDHRAPPAFSRDRAGVLEPRAIRHIGMG